MWVHVSRTNIVSKISCIFVDEIWPNFHQGTRMDALNFGVKKVKVMVGSNMPQNALFGLISMIHDISSVIATCWQRHNGRQSRNHYLVFVVYGITNYHYRQNVCHIFAEALQVPSNLHVFVIDFEGFWNVILFVILQIASLANSKR